MNNRDLAALAALGAMGYMYKRHLDGQGAEAGPADAAGRYPPVSDLVNRGALGTADAKRDIRMGGFDNTPAAVGVGTAGPDKRSDMDDFAIGTGIQGRGGNEQRYRDYRGTGSGSGSGSGTGSGSGSAAGTIRAERFAPYPEVGAGGAGGMGAVAPEESGGMGGAGLAAGAGLGAAGAAAYYARLRAQARAMKPRPITGDLSETQKMFAAGPDRSPRPITGDLSETQKMFAAGPDRAAIAEAKNRAIQTEIDDELKRYKNKTKGANDRAGVNKSAAAAGPTVTRETPTKKRAPVKVEAPTDMDDFNRMLRESKVGRATTTTTTPVSRTSANAQTREDAKADEARQRLSSLGTTPADKTPKVRNLPGKLGLAATALGLGTAANAATDMTAGQRERLAKDVMEGLVTPLGLTPGMAGEGSELYPSKPLSSAERKKIIEAMSPADRKKYEEAVARQGQNSFTFKDFKNYITSKKAAGGQIKTKRMASGGMTSTVSSASKRGDGIASKGKTRCKMY